MSDVCKNASCKYYATQKEVEQMADLELQNAALPTSQRKPFEQLEIECVFLEQQAAQKRKDMNDQLSNDY